jgi:hypothetical protein
MSAACIFKAIFEKETLPSLIQTPENDQTPEAACVSNISPAMDV